MFNLCKTYYIIFNFFYTIFNITSSCHLLFKQCHNIRHFIWIFFASFSTATLVTIVYQYVITKDFSNSIAENLLFNKEFLSKILNESKIEKLLKNLLQRKMSISLANVVKERIIDQISDDQQDYVLYGVHYYITLNQLSEERFSNYYKLNVKQTFFEKIYTDCLTIYATNNPIFWNILGKEALNVKKGIELVWLMPDKITDDIFERQTDSTKIKEFFNAKLMLKHIPIEPDYNFIKGEELSNLVGLPAGPNDYCIEIRFILSNSVEIMPNQEIEKFCEFESIVFKYKHHIRIINGNAHNTINVDWDCTNTDIVRVTPITTIDNISQPTTRHPQNLRHSIISYSPGLPGQQIVYVWQFTNETNISSQTILPLNENN